MHGLATPLTFADRMAIRHFRQSLPKHRRARFDEGLAAVMESERAFITDKPTQEHALLCGSALCAYRQWQGCGLDQAGAKARVAQQTATLWKRSFTGLMWVMCAMARDPFEAVRRHTAERVGNAYGAGFEISYTEMEDGFASVVTRCGYHAFLQRHGAPELLDLFCEWDRIWIDALPRSIRFTRPPTIAAGGAECRFEFRRRD